MNNDCKNVVISGYYGFGNFGDEAILRVIVDKIKSLDEKISITVLSKNPSITSKRLNVDSIDRMRIFDIIKCMSNSDLFISGGGSLLQDKTSALTIYYYLMLILLGNIFSKKCFIFANGVGPIGWPVNRLLTRMILKNVDYITVRDENSQKLLKSLKINSELTQDPVWLGLNKNSTEKIIEKYELNSSKSTIGINIRPWADINILEIDLLAKAINHNFSQNTQILLMPVHYHFDKPASEDLFNLLKTLNPHLDVVLIDEDLPPEAWAGLMDYCNSIIAMRYHVIMLAATLNKEIFAISYDPKVIALSETLKAHYITIEQWKNKKIDLLMQNWLNKAEKGLTYSFDPELFLNLANRNFQILKDLIQE